ncbi:MAG: hypothetical protein ACRER2_08055, partial [Methylococcales bacterium]
RFSRFGAGQAVARPGQLLARASSHFVSRARGGPVEGVGVAARLRFGWSLPGLRFQPGFRLGRQRRVYRASRARESGHCAVCG